jgi:hypothetical protein
MYKFNKLTVFIIALLIGTLVVLNVLLIVQNKNLKDTSKSMDREIVLQEGKMVKPLSGRDAEGKTHVFEWGADERKTLMMIFSPRCGYCLENMPMWDEIIKKADNSAFRIVAASSVADGTAEFIKDYQIKNIPLVVETEPSSKVDYVMYLTPQTVLLKPNGEVEKVWIGPIQNEIKNEVENYLNIELSTEIASN